MNLATALRQSPAPYYNIDHKLHYANDRKEFFGDVSNFGKMFNFFQLYNDACDVGIRLRSVKTGQETLWYLAEDQTVRQEGDVLLWKLYPTDETVRAVPQLTGHSITLFND